MITDKKISANQFNHCHQCSCSKILDEDAKAESYYLMKAQEESGSVSMLNEPEEDAWNELYKRTAVRLLRIEVNDARFSEVHAVMHAWVYI